MSREFAGGSSDQIDIGTWSTTGNSISIALWFALDDLESSQFRYISKASGGGEADHTWMISNDSAVDIRPRIRLRRNGNTDTFQNTERTNDTNWHHLCFTYDGGSNVGETYFDLDTRFAADSWSHTETTGNIDQNTDSIEIGNQPGGNSEIDGHMAWVTIWNVAIIEAEVEALVRGVNPTKIRPSDQLACYPLWGLQSPEIDLTPNARSGTVTGATLGTRGPPVEPFFISSHVFEDPSAAPPAGDIPIFMHHYKLLAG